MSNREARLRMFVFAGVLYISFSMMIYKTPAKKMIPFSRIAAGRPVRWLEYSEVECEPTMKMPVGREVEWQDTKQLYQCSGWYWKQYQKISL